MRSTVLKIVTEKEFMDITNRVQCVVDDVGFDSGVVLLHSVHTTCGLKIMEDELLSLFDIDCFLERLVPMDGGYAHDRINLRQVPADERVNAYSHIRMLFFQSSLVVPVMGGRLVLGEWQRIFLAEMDGAVPFRERSVMVSVFDDHKEMV